MKNYIFAFVFFLLFYSEAHSQSLNSGKDDLLVLVNLMQGSFSSQEQSKNDTDYFDIRLHMKKIWNDRTDGYWLYVEQAVASAMEKPYRQRVYHITQNGDSIFESSVFTLNNPLRFAGDWKKENALESLTPDSLVSREGCSVYLIKTGEKIFEGSTEGKDCQSDLRGAKYAKSEVKVTYDGLISWDRGYDENDKQVWGAEKGGYIFKRIQ